MLQRTRVRHRQWTQTTGERKEARKEGRAVSPRNILVERAQLVLRALVALEVQQLGDLTLVSEVLAHALRTTAAAKATTAPQPDEQRQQQQHTQSSDETRGENTTSAQ